MVIDSQEISLTLPSRAENGAVVPVTIASDLDGLEQLYLLVENNPTPLAAVFHLSAEVAVFITTRVKMAQSGDVHILAKQDGRWLHCRQRVEVMLGGCGTG